MENKPTKKGDYEVSFLGSDKTAIITYSFWKGYCAPDYDSPDEPDTIEIDKIIIDNIDMTDILYEIAEDWVEGVEEELLEHCSENY